MKRIFKKFKEKIASKQRPSPYSERVIAFEDDHQGLDNTIGANRPTCEVIDLLANCKLSAADDSDTAEYAEIGDMGLWHSTPLAQKHKSKLSLTWVLKDNIQNAKITKEKIQSQDRFKTKIISDEVEKQKINTNTKYIEVERPRRCRSRDLRVRVVGRNEYYHHLRFRNACEEFTNGYDTYSDTSVGTEEYIRKKHRHRHRRKKKKPNGRFGYDIKDLDSFLTEASIDRPGNIPVVVSYPSVLFQTHKGSQQELSLPLGTVVNAVFKNKQWLYAQTPHGEEGYVLYSACLPLGILPSRTSPQKKTPCWESSTDIYPRPCGNLTDNEKEQMRGRTRSECSYNRKPKNSCAERDFDTLYLKTKSVCSIDKVHEKENCRDLKRGTVKRQTLLVVNSDYIGSVLNRTLTVRKGDVVVLEQDGIETDVDAEWFYVRKRDGSLGFIPAAVAGHGYI